MPAHLKTLRYTILWKCLCWKIGVHQSWVKRTPVQDSAIQNSCSKYSSNDVSVIFVYWRKHFQRSRRRTYTEWPTVRTSSNREERRRNKTPSPRSITDGISRRVTSGWHYMCLIVSHGVKVTTVPARHTLDLKRVLHLSARQCSGAQEA